MRMTKFLATGLVAVMMVATATGCGKSTANGNGSNGKETFPSPTVAESHAAVVDLSTLESSNSTDMQWKWYEDAAKKLEGYKFTDYKSLKYADEYTKDRVVFTAASEQLKEDLSDYEQYYQIAKIEAIASMKGALSNYGVDLSDSHTFTFDGNDKIKSICEVYPIDYSVDKNRLIYFAGVELNDGTVSELIGSIQFVEKYIPTFSQGENGKVQNGTEEEPTGGKIWKSKIFYTTDNDLVTMKLTMASYDKEADNNKDVFKESHLIAR